MRRTPTGFEQRSRALSCFLLEAIFALAPESFAVDQPAKKDVDEVLGKLIRLGIAEAHGLEEALRQLQ